MKKKQAKCPACPGWAPAASPAPPDAPLWPAAALCGPLSGAGCGSQVRAWRRPAAPGRAGMWFSFAEPERRQCSPAAPLKAPPWEAGGSGQGRVLRSPGLRAEQSDAFIQRSSAAAAAPLRSCHLGPTGAPAEHGHPGPPGSDASAPSERPVRPGSGEIVLIN